jgi:hypothetical protein
VLRASYDAAAADLGNSGASGNLGYTIMTDELRLKLTELNGLGSHGRALATMMGESAPGFADAKASAEAMIAAVKEKATAAADQLANAGEDPSLAPVKAYFDGVKKNADDMTVEKLMVPPAPAAKPKAAAKSSGRSMSGGDAGAGESLEAIMAKIAATEGDPEASAKLMAELIDDSTPAAKAMKSMAAELPSAMKPVMDALTEKFGAEGAKALQDGMAGMVGGMGRGMNPAMLKGLNEKSNDGTTAVFESDGGQQITFVKTSSGWKFDMFAGMDPAQAQMMEQAAPMMSMMIGPMKKAAETIAAKIRSGEIASAEEVPAALQQEIMKSMGGGLGGGGGRGRAPRN